MNLRLFVLFPSSLGHLLLALHIDFQLQVEAARHASSTNRCSMHCSVEGKSLRELGARLSIFCVSGTICNPGPRKSMSKLHYIRLALFLPEMVWASLGAAWIADDVQCDKTVVNGIIATVVIR